MNSRQRLSNKSFSTIEQKKDDLELQLVLRQQPKHCRVLIKGEKVGRRPLEPAPVIQLIGKNKKNGDNNKDYLYSPNIFMKARVEAIEIENGNVIDSQKNSMYSSSIAFGCLISSVQTVKDLDKSDVSFFVFPNISIKYEGVFRIHFELYDLVNDVISKVCSISSDSFIVSHADKFPGWEKTTPLTHLLSSQGVKVNLRKRNHVTIHNSKNSSSKDSKTEEQKVKKTKENKKQIISATPVSKTIPSVLSSSNSNSPFSSPSNQKENEKYFQSSKKIKISPNQTPFILYPTFPFVFSPQFVSTPLSAISSSSLPSSPSSSSSIPQRDQMTDAKLLLSLCNIANQTNPRPTQPKLESKSSGQLPSFFDLVNSLPPPTSQ